MDPAAGPRMGRVHPRAFTRIPTVRTADEITDSAFRKAAKITVHQKDAFQRMKTTETARVRSVQNSVATTLLTYVKKFPSFDGLSPFYREIAHLLVDLDATRKSLGALQWAAARVEEIGNEAVVAIKRAPHAEQLLPAKSQAYGRIASVLKQVDGDLRGLDASRQALKKIPVIEAEHPTLVVAGYPNVGKSSLVRRVSTGTPEVASYPFTTKGVVVGHFEHKHARHQIVDTPGLLDRPIEARNDIERQALHALRHLADVIVFLVDPSEHCGYPLDAQLKLLEETRAAFPDAPLVVAESKSDLKSAGVGEVAFSAETGEGVDALMALALSRLRPRA